MKNEIRESQPFALELRLGDYRTTVVLDRRRRRKHAGSIGAGESDSNSDGDCFRNTTKKRSRNEFPQ